MIASLFSIHLRLITGISSRCRAIWFKGLGVRFEGSSWLRRVSIPRRWSDVYLGHNVALDDGVVLICTGDSPAQRICILSGTYINRYTIIDASERISIGTNTLIGPHCYLTDHDHTYSPESLTKHLPLKSKPVSIGNNVWIGAGAIILKGVSIGDNAIIAAGAVVTHDVPASSLAAGVPARLRSPYPL